MRSWIASHFKVASQSGENWSVWCPLHEDKNPSASVNWEKGVFNCFKCGGMALSKVADSMFWDAPPSANSKPQYKPDTMRAHEVCRYDYRDENGKLLYQIVRKLQADGSKTFSAYRVDNKEWKLGDCKRVPYRLPQLISSIAKRDHVFIVEGEKDCDTLASLGISATTNTFGARSTKIWEDHARYFPPGCKVYIIPDADYPGVEHAKKIETILLAKNCKVTILNLGYVVKEKHGEDVSDWLEQGHTVEDFVNLLTDTHTETKESSKVEIQQAKHKDYGHAVVLSEKFKGRYRYALHRKQWMQYSGKVWEPISDERMNKIAADELIEYYQEVCIEAIQTFHKRDASDAMLKWREAQTYARVQGALNFLRGWEGIMTEHSEWDRCPWFFNCLTGTIDLRDGQLHDHDVDQLITQIAPVEYQPEAGGGLWSAHIEKFLPDFDVRRMVQRNLGLSLCGAQLAEIFPIWYGTGGNGKTTTIRVIQNILGNYAIKAVTDLLIASKYEKHPAELADLCGARCVFSIETDRERRLAEARVKELTGGEPIKARYMYGNFFQFEKTWTLFLITNHKPIIGGTDEGIWRRVKLIPWTVCVTNKDRIPQDEMMDMLMQESSGILNWLLAGFRDAIEDPEWEAPEVGIITNEYKHDQDRLSGFFDDACEIGKQYRCISTELYQAYCRYCENMNEKPYQPRSFNKMLKEREFILSHAGGKSEFTGLRLKGTELDF